MTIDEELKNLLPPLTDEEFRQLEENCIKEGIREAILVWDRGDDLVIVDGHNRYQIARKHGLKWSHKVMPFKDKDEAKLWIMTNQLGRRNLPDYVKTVIALKVKPAITKKAKDKEAERKTTLTKSTKSNMPSINTRKEVAKIAGVSEDTVRKVEKIEAEATPQTKERLKKGELSINQAYNTTFPKTLNPVKEATKEHEEYQEKLKSGVVDIQEAKRDKTNQDIMFNGFMQELYKALGAVNSFGIMYTRKDVDKKVEKIPQKEKEDLILKIDCIIGILDYARAAIERSQNAGN